MSLSWDSGQGFMGEADQWEGYLAVEIHKNGGAHWRSEHGDEGIQYNLPSPEWYDWEDERADLEVKD